VWTDRLYISNVARDAAVTSWTAVVPSVRSFSNRFAPALVNSQGNLLIMGGWVEPGNVWVNDVWVTPDEGTSWRLMAKSSGFEPRRTATAVATGRVVILGLGPNQTTAVARSVWIGWF